MNLESGLQPNVYAGVDPGSPCPGSPHSPVQARELVDFREDSGLAVRPATRGGKACLAASFIAACIAACILVLLAGQANASGHNEGVLGVQMSVFPWQTSTSTTSTVTQTSTLTTTTQASTSTSSITTTTTSITITTTSTGTTYPYPSLFCFSVMRAHGYELSLVRMQLSKGASIFACEEWSVFSDVKTWLSPGPPVRIETSVLNTSLVARSGQIEHILNTEIFMAAFEQIHQDPRFKFHDFLVKVDPDAVFIPKNLKSRLLLAAPQRDTMLYLTNCKASFKLFGALEVFSRKAMEAYFKGTPSCKAHLPWRQWGEDLWMRRCLDFLKVPHMDDFGLLSDAYCGAKPSPCSSGSAAFHPFKAPETYMNCLLQADPQIIST